MAKPKKRLDCPICGSTTYCSRKEIRCDNNKCVFYTNSRTFDVKCGFFLKDKSNQLLNKNRCQNDSAAIIKLYTGGYMALCLDHIIENNQFLCIASQHWNENKEIVNIINNIFPLKFGEEAPVIPEPATCLLNENYFLSKEQIDEKYKFNYNGRRNCVICGPYYVEQERQNEPHKCESDKLRSFIGFLAGKSHS